jgi:hypothetical protein
VAPPDSGRAFFGRPQPALPGEQQSRCVREHKKWTRA